MSDNIKLVYSWIGPKGPIVNTELPNILCFAGVAEGASTSSLRFWADDIWWRVFHERGPYELASPWGIDHRHTFIYPFTLTWRVPFETYFYPGSGILEFGHTPNHIIEQVRNGKGYILIDMTAEAFIRPNQLQSLHQYFSHTNRIPMNKIIYLTGCMNPNEVYDKWCQSSGMLQSPDDRMHLISFPISQHSISTAGAITEPNYDTETVPEKVFLSWNRRFRRHRTELAIALEHHGLVDRSYISMGLVDPEKASMTFESTIPDSIYQVLDVTPSSRQSFINKLPLVLDGETDINQMCQDFDSAARPFYTNSLVSLVTETNYTDPEVTLTEKTFKPSKEKHPFIIVGVPGSLVALRKMGFQTFGDFWDESYDETTDPAERMRKIISVCKYIGSWDSNKIIDFKRRVKPILENNFNAVKQDTAQVVAENIYKAIKNTTP